LRKVHWGGFYRTGNRAGCARRAPDAWTAHTSHITVTYVSVTSASSVVNKKGAPKERRSMMLPILQSGFRGGLVLWVGRRFYLIAPRDVGGLDRAEDDTIQDGGRKVGVVGHHGLAVTLEQWTAPSK